MSSLIECGKPVIDEFISLGFGRLKLDITVEDGGISHAAFKRDAPCGCTWYVAKKLNWTDVADYKETASSAHHTHIRALRVWTGIPSLGIRYCIRLGISLGKLWRKGWGIESD